MARLVFVSSRVKGGRAEQGQVVALGRTACEDDLFRLPAEQIGNRAGGGFNRRGRFGAEGMRDAACIAVALGQIGQHGLNHAGIDPRGRLVVEVNPLVHVFPRCCPPLSAVLCEQGPHADL